MSNANYDRLSAQDHSFLVMEKPNVHMHVAATSIYDAGPLSTPEGGIDIGAYRHATEAVMHLIPRYRQRLEWVPFLNTPVWVDDRHFDIDYHIRHTSLPRPGTEEQLKRLAARIMSQPLDRTKPLWEFWVIEGLDGGRYAVITKMHHCMIDGSSGVDLATTMMSITPEHELPEIHPFVPRPAPAMSELLKDELLHRATLPLAAISDLREFGRQTEDLKVDLTTRVAALGELAGYAMSGASDTPLNGRIGPHRKFDWLKMPLERIKSVRRAFGCTVNDLILATVTGAVRAYLIRRRVNPAEVDFRVSAPVSVRKDEDRGKLGNKVSSWIVRLPLAEESAVARLDAIHNVTQGLKKSQQALGVQMLMAAAEWAPATLLSLGSQSTSTPINMIVTNVPGPQIPLYMLGGKLLEMYPQVPLLENTGLGIALFSYDGKVFWGFNADPDLVPDLKTFVRMIEDSFDELAECARLKPAPSVGSDSKGPTKEAEAPAGEDAAAGEEPVTDAESPIDDLGSGGLA